MMSLFHSTNHHRPHLRSPAGNLFRNSPVFDDNVCWSDYCVDPPELGSRCWWHRRCRSLKVIKRNNYYHISYILNRSDTYPESYCAGRPAWTVWAAWRQLEVVRWMNCVRYSDCLTHSDWRTRPAASTVDCVKDWDLQANRIYSRAAMGGYTRMGITCNGTELQCELGSDSLEHIFAKVAGLQFCVAHQMIDGIGYLH